MGWPVDSQTIPPDLTDALTPPPGPPQLWWVYRKRDGAPGLALHPHPGQAQALASTARLTFVLAGSQGGKTALGPVWLLREIEARRPGDFLAVTATFDLLKLKMLPELLRLFRGHLRMAQWRATEKVLLFTPRPGETEPTRLIIRSASNPESLESATAKAAWLDECGQSHFRVEAWEAIRRRLSLHEGRVLATTTLYNAGWLKQQIYDRWRAGDPEITVIQFPSTLNPAFPTAEFERARERMPHWRFAMFHLGQFERPAGLIYADFDDRLREEGGHVVTPFDIPDTWVRHVGLDFGGVHTAVLHLAHEPESGAYYVYQESLSGGRTTRAHAADLQRTLAGLTVGSIYGGSGSEDQQRLDWTDAGVYVNEPPIRDVEAGIDRVVELFRTRRLFIFASCHGLLDELGSYSRVLDEQSQPTERIRDKETYHYLDSLRYVTSGLMGPIAYGSTVEREPIFRSESRRLFR